MGNFLQKTFKIMGDNKNSAIWVACLIAAFKGGFRPYFTMKDKQSDHKTKKYAAIREGMTEGIAIPVYIAVPGVFGSLAVKAYEKLNKEGVKTAAQKVIEKNAIEANVKFLGVLASTAIIPLICNIIQPPIMNAIKKHNDTKNTAIADNNFKNEGNVVNPVNKPAFSGKINYGMRIGS